MAMNILFEPETSIVEKAFITFGGMAPTTIFALNTCAALVGR